MKEKSRLNDSNPFELIEKLYPKGSEVRMANGLLLSILGEHVSYFKDKRGRLPAGFSESSVVEKLFFATAFSLPEEKYDELLSKINADQQANYESIEWGSLVDLFVNYSNWNARFAQSLIGSPSVKKRSMPEIADTITQPSQHKVHANDKVIGLMLVVTGHAGTINDKSTINLIRKLNTEVNKKIIRKREIVDRLVTFFERLTK